MLRLSRHHLNNLKKQPVILAPCSIRATLLPNQLFLTEKCLTVRGNNENTNKNEETHEANTQHWNNWQKIYKVILNNSITKKFFIEFTR